MLVHFVFAACLIGAAGQAAPLEEAHRHLRQGKPVSLLTSATHGKIAPPGYGPPRPLGRTFYDAPIGNHDWVHQNPPNFVTGDLDPTAPLDRVDSVFEHSTVSGARPVTPGNVHRTLDLAPPMTPDYMPATRIRQRTFPQQAARGVASIGGGGLDSPAGTSPLIPMAQRRLIAKADRLRPPQDLPVVGSIKSELIDDPARNYPLRAPLDGLPNGEVEAVAQPDKLPKSMSKFLEQRAAMDQRRLEMQRLNKEWDRVESNRDSVISAGEFKVELHGRQGKTQEEVDRLWEKYHQSESKYMTKAEFMRLARTGYDLGTITRGDASTVLTPLNLKGLGYWGSGATCPKGTYATGARLKVQGPEEAKASGDESGINAVEFKCESSINAKAAASVSTVEGQDGTWTKWMKCPEGQYLYSLRSRGKAPVAGFDNAGLEGLEFGCRKPDLSEMATLSFRADTVEAQHGWSKEQRCEARERICGAQANLVKDGADKMGIADIRFYCCNSPIDCSDICEDAVMGAKLAKCRACQHASGIDL